MRYGSVCSGVEAATLAWAPLGWKAEFFSEIEPFPAAVLAHHYPEVPNLGDMTKIIGENYIGKIDLLTGGSPCQSFSFAGLRKGLDDPRGNLCLKFAELAHHSRVRWILWENVPGVLSSNRGADFAGLLSLLCGWQVDVPADRKGVRKWKNAGIINPAPAVSALLGVCLTLNIPEYPDSPALSLNDGGVSSLSDIVVTGDLPQQYYLTVKACRGILHRAAKRKRELPAPLRQALEAQVQRSSSIISSTEPESR